MSGIVDRRTAPDALTARLTASAGRCIRNVGDHIRIILAVGEIEGLDLPSDVLNQFLDRGASPVPPSFSSPRAPSGVYEALIMNFGTAISSRR